MGLLPEDGGPSCSSVCSSEAFPGLFPAQEGFGPPGSSARLGVGDRKREPSKAACGALTRSLGSSSPSLSPVRPGLLNQGAAGPAGLWEGGRGGLRIKQGLPELWLPDSLTEPGLTDGVEPCSESVHAMPKFTASLLPRGGRPPCHWRPKGPVHRTGLLPAVSSFRFHE